MALLKGNFSQRDILVVDDDKDICEILKEYIIRMGCFKNIVFAHDGIMATLKLRNQKFALILLDVNMPKKSGVDLIAEFDGNTLNKKESVLVVSGTLDKDVISAMMNGGIKNFLVKPFDEAAFQEKALKVLSAVNNVK